MADWLVLLFGQNMTRIVAPTTSDVTGHGQDVSIRLGRHGVPVPQPLGRLLLTLIQDGKPSSASARTRLPVAVPPGSYPAVPSWLLVRWRRSAWSAGDGAPLSGRRMAGGTLYA